MVIALFAAGLLAAMIVLVLVAACSAWFILVRCFHA